MLRRSGFDTVQMNGSVMSAGCTRQRVPMDTGTAHHYPWIDVVASFD